MPAIGRLVVSTTARTVLAVPKSTPTFRRPLNFLHSPVSTSSAKLDKVLFFNSIQNTPFLSDRDKKNFAPDINSNNCGR